MIRKVLLASALALVAVWQGPTLMSVSRLKGGTAGRILQDNATSASWNVVSGDSSVNSSGVWLNSKINGNSYPSGFVAGDMPYGSGSSVISRRAIGSAGNVLTVSGGLPVWAPPATSGTVTSFSAGNFSPLFTTGVATSTSTPSLSFAAITQTANLVFAGPSSGGAVAPTFRSLVAADIPSLSYVTSVGLTVPSWLSVSGSPVTGAGTLAVTATTGQTANQVLASPNGTTGAFGPRSLVAADIPNLDTGKLTTGQLGPARGGTGADLSASGSSTAFLAQDGSHVVTARSLITADLPAGTGTVTSVTSGNFSPLFNVTVANTTTTPAFSYAALTQSANLGFFGPSTGSAAAPTFRAMVPLDIAGSAATGGLHYASSGTVNAWLAVGSSNQVLTVSGGLPSWQTWNTGLPGAGTSGQMLYDNGTSWVGSGTAINWNASTLQITPASGNVAFQGISSGGPVLALQTSVSSTNTANGNRLGQINFQGKANSVLANGAGLTSVAAATWATGSSPGDLIAQTTSSGSTTLTNRGRWTAAGSFYTGDGAALATNATAGQVRIPTCAGIPSGTPEGGTGSLVYDTTDARLDGWNGSVWVNLTPGADTIATAASGTVTLTASQVPGLFIGTNGTAVILNIPAASACQGFSLKVVASGSSFITVTRAGSDTVDGGTTFNVTSGKAATFESDGVSKWVITGVR